MTWAYTTRSASAVGAGVASVNITLNSTVAGNFIGVGTACAAAGGLTAAPTSLAVSDGTNGSYTQSGYVTNSDVGAGLHFFAQGAGGNLTITSNPSGASGDSNDMLAVAAEFSGGAASPASGTPSTATGTSATPATGNTVPAVNDCLVLAAMVTDGGNPTENNASEGYSLIGESDGTGGEPGSFVYKILSGGSGANQSESWAAPLEVWGAVIAAFAPAITRVPLPWQNFGAMGVQVAQ